MKTQKVHGIGFGGWLALIFITLKLCKVIAWSWWWVLAPLWIPFSIGLLFLLIAGIAWIFVKLLPGK